MFRIFRFCKTAAVFFCLTSCAVASQLSAEMIFADLADVPLPCTRLYRDESRTICGSAVENTGDTPEDFDSSCALAEARALDALISSAVPPTFMDEEKDTELRSRTEGIMLSGSAFRLHIPHGDITYAKGKDRVCAVVSVPQKKLLQLTHRVESLTQKERNALKRAAAVKLARNRVSAGGFNSALAYWDRAEEISPLSTDELIERSRAAAAAGHTYETQKILLKKLDTPLTPQQKNDIEELTCAIAGADGKAAKLRRFFMKKRAAEKQIRETAQKNNSGS